VVRQVTEATDVVMSRWWFIAATAGVLEAIRADYEGIWHAAADSVRASQTLLAALEVAGAGTFICRRTMVSTWL
jgi:hypothetical protein